MENGQINGNMNGKHDEHEQVEDKSKDSSSKVKSTGSDQKPKAKSFVEQIKKNFSLPTKSSASKSKESSKGDQSTPKTKPAPKPPVPSEKPKKPASVAKEQSNTTKSEPKSPKEQTENAKTKEQSVVVKDKGIVSKTDEKSKSVLLKDKGVASCTEEKSSDSKNTKTKRPAPLPVQKDNKSSPQNSGEANTDTLNKDIGASAHSIKTPNSQSETSERLPIPKRQLFPTETTVDSSDKNLPNYTEQKRKNKLDIPQDKCILDLVTSPMATGNEAQAIGPLEYIYVTDNKLKYMNQNFEKVSAKMYDYKCDIKLKVGNENYKAHRDVLSKASDYFAAMFSCDMKEKDQDVIELKEISPKGFSAMMDYFYHGNVTIDPNNTEDVIEAARFFHNDWLLECCCDFLVRHLSLENYTAVITLADKYWLGDLRWDIFRFIGENLPNLTQQEKFYPNLSLELLLQFLMENMYIEASERFVLDLILNWVDSNPDERKEHLLSLLRQVRFPLMELEELETLPDEIMKISEIKDAVEDALNYNLNVMGQCLKTDDIYLQRGFRTVIVVLSFSDEGSVLVYRDPEKPGFFIEQLGPTGLDTSDYHAVCQSKLGNFLYAAGGYDETYSSTNRVFRFDPRYRDWTEVGCMNESRVSFAMCSSNTQLFVLGGVNRVEEDETVLGSVEAYTPEDNSWRNLQPLPIKCCDAAIAVLNNCLYVSGGISIDPSDPIPLNNTWCLDLSSDSGWVPKQNLQTGRQGHSMVPYNGKLYAIGGYTSKSGLMTFQDCITNEVFDTETNQWTEIAPTPEHFGHLYRHNGICGSKIYVMGSNTPVANLYVYDIEADTWEECESIGPNMQKLAILDVAYPYN